jgi:SAM-dependent methyltransferase
MLLLAFLGIVSIFSISMDRSEFDRFADEYRSLHQANIAISGEAPEYFAEYKIKDLKSLVGMDLPIRAGAHFLDFGAGVGTSVPFFCRHLPAAKLTCVDVSLRSLEIGVAKHGGHANFVAFDGVSLPFADAAFDGVLAACVFHHIGANEHERLFAEIRRVLRPGGLVMIYEHNPLNPLTRRAVHTCPFDTNAVLVGPWRLKSRLESVGFKQSRIKFRVFFPKAVRWLRPLEDSIGWLPLGAQYYVCGRA